jgi:hypothetical protein
VVITTTSSTLESTYVLKFRHTSPIKAQILLSKTSFTCCIIWPSTLGLGVPVDSWIERNLGVKNQWIEKFLIPLKISWNVIIWNGLAWPIWVLKIQVMAKRKAKTQSVNLTPAH